jgi:PLP dependent protein
MVSLTNAIQQNIETVITQIGKAAQSVGRDEKQVKLVVVTKAQPLEVVKAVIEAGGKILGENYPEESVAKIDAFGRPEGLAWHMIGHLQSRKANLIVTHFDLLQSLDSLHLAEKLERLCAEQGKILPVMIEYNVGGEASKHGWPAWDENHWDDLIPPLEAILALQHLSIRGVMTMPPWNEDPQKTRPYFVALRNLAEFLSHRFGNAHFQELSMGTSTDFAAAVEEGATLVRIGTAIVGPRLPRG